jgi:hypothetical protein
VRAWKCLHNRLTNQLGVCLQSAKPPAGVIRLGNSGLSDGPVKGQIKGPFTSVRATTLPWNLRHLVGQQVNGAPEPLVYSPVYTFDVQDKLPKPKPMDLFKNPDLYKMKFATPNGKFVVQGQGARKKSRYADPRAFEIVSPQPPPYVAPLPPSSAEASDDEAAAAEGPATDPEEDEEEEEEEE